MRCWLLLLLLMWQGPGQASQWVVDVDSSRLGFTAEFEGVPFDGLFRQWQADVTFDPAALAGRFDVRVSLGSVDSNLSERDEALQLDEWFAVMRFPDARYLSSEFQQSGEKFTAEGRLSLKGHELPVRLLFNWDEQGQSARLNGEAMLNRLDFAVGEGEDFAGEDIVAHQVKVWFTLQLTRRSE